jgi:hypothetical protein
LRVSRFLGTLAERMAFVLLRKPTGQDIADPNIFIEGFSPETLTLHTQSDLLELPGSRSRQPRKF